MNILCLTPVKHIDKVYDILCQCGEVFYYPDEIQPERILECINTIKPAALFVNPNKMKYKLDSYLLNNDCIKVVCTASTGTNHIDMEFCKNKGIEVLSLTKEMDVINKISSTAEMAFALMLSLIRNIPSAYDHVKEFQWNYEPFIGRQLDALTVGIVGYGRLGKIFEKFCRPFFKDILICDPYKESQIFSLNRVNFDQLLERADVISLHVHLNRETQGMIGKEALRRVKTTGTYLINTSRGEIVDELEVLKALQDGRLLGYATDVIVNELDKPITTSPFVGPAQRLNVIITPHIGGMTREAQEIAYQASAHKLLAFFKK